MSELTLIKTHPGELSFPLFEAVLENVYEADSLRLKQTESVNQSFLVECWIVMRNDVPLARLAIYNNPQLRFQEQQAGCIGNYECENDPETARFILQKAFERLKELEISYVIGPMNGSTWDNYRFSTHHNAAPFLLEPHHHLYYNDQFIENGFEVISNYTSSFDTSLPHDLPELLERERYFSALGVVIRSIDLTRFDKELESLYPFILAAFQTNFLYTPIDWESFRDKYREALKIIDPDFVLIAEDAHKQPIGFVFAYQNLYCTTEKQLVIKTIARSYDKQWSGLGHVIANQVIRNAGQHGFSALIHAFMIRQATSTEISRNFSGEVYKNYALYGRSL
ncbi:MAG: hypothetical protein A3D31_07105 [Candidatus Fluviicola riflensis]|nr:MAG: hypothetical protein CHH17_07905 [Candidatus Fluviicola riflensis]OGS79719.1 MAG: hypothetical protein A3D31_07105 [Candidatus Fluviicola riflensis]OGS87152.1 MAG: hypothetical protein A2724_06565 [Fluviicola sp. RIFCSPHIGHO2_01_FULL_43_53]OGS89940.1 MAG: hypothetical protein A3E30_03310 [Fluviicola sp. RIFCSPHIGHO2_12_FULL_43_24]